MKQTMTFTPQTPTAPGFFLWKTDANDPDFCFRYIIISSEYGVLIDRDCGLKTSQFGGLWCLLVPENECVPKEEVEKAWLEGFESGPDQWKANSRWHGSRAKRVMEGIE